MTGLTEAQVEDKAARFVALNDDVANNIAADEHFAGLGLDAIRARLSTADDPVLGGSAWSLSAPLGGDLMIRTFVSFPAPEAVPAASNLYLMVWVGSGNPDPDLSTFLLNVDPRFPRLAGPKPPGLRPGTTDAPELGTFPDRSMLEFHLRIPSDVEPSVYLGNVCLMRRAPFGVGDCLGRGSFAFRVRGVDEPPDTNPPH